MNKKYFFKKQIRCLLFFILIFFYKENSFSQATVTSNPTANDIAAQLQTAGIIISNPTITSGISSQLGVFSNGTAGAALELDTGVAFTTSTITNAFSTNNLTANSDNLGISYNDIDVINIDNTANNDVVIFEFDFVAQPNYSGVLVEYQFGSDEYPDYVGSRFNDVFGFFVSDPSGSDPSIPNGVDLNSNGLYDGLEEPSLNLALVPGTTNSVSINNINGGFRGCNQDGTAADLTQTALYINNGHTGDGSTCSTNTGTKPIHVEFNGITQKFSAVINLIVGVTYHMKIAIADVGDATYDSGVFISSVGGLPIITTSNDSGSTTTLGGVAVTNVLLNDTVGGVVNPSVSNVELAQISSTNAGVSLNTATGEVIVAPGTPVGDYTLVYNVCKPSPTNCSSSSVLVSVLPVIDAVTETTTPVNGLPGGTTSALTANDTLNGSPVTVGTNPGDVTVTPVTVPTGLTLNS
ncbi:choice-of-anchor L domain-containing protein, partial [Tenacibaculum ascidiaceicola]